MRRPQIAKRNIRFMVLILTGPSQNLSMLSTDSSSCFREMVSGFGTALFPPMACLVFISKSGLLLLFPGREDYVNNAFRVNRMDQVRTSREFSYDDRTKTNPLRKYIIPKTRTETDLNECSRSRSLCCRYLTSRFLWFTSSPSHFVV